MINHRMFWPLRKVCLGCAIGIVAAHPFLHAFEGGSLDAVMPSVLAFIEAERDS